jgi:hypothetical protein
VQEGLGDMEKPESLNGNIRGKSIIKRSGDSGDQKVRSTGEECSRLPKISMEHDSTSRL